MTDPDGDYAGNLFVTLKWKDPYKKRSVPVDPPLPIITSTQLIEPMEDLPKKKSSSRKTLENYFNENKSDKESLPEKSPTPPPPKSPTPPLPDEENEYTTPPPETPEINSLPPTPVPLDKTLDSLPDYEEAKQNDDTAEKEEENDIEEEIVESEEIDEEIQSGSVSFNVVDDSGLSGCKIFNKFYLGVLRKCNIFLKQNFWISCLKDTAPITTPDTKEYTPAVISIKKLEAIEGVEPLSNSVFVEYEFCGQVKETEASLPFPTIDKPALFDYSETFKFTVKFWKLISWLGANKIT